jgi:hypothetical protein
MPQLIKPSTKVKIVPKDGELEITLNINISVDGKVVASADKADVFAEQEQEEKVPHIIPDFFSGNKLNFGKKE